MKKHKTSEIQINVSVKHLLDGRFSASATVEGMSSASETSQTAYKAAAKAVESLMFEVDKTVLWKKSVNS